MVNLKELHARILITINLRRNKNMEQLQYIIEDKTIAYLLGTNNFTNDESAVLELVKSKRSIVGIPTSNSRS